MNRNERITLFSNLKKEFLNVSIFDIENGVMCYCLSSLKKPYENYNKGKANEVSEILKRWDIPTDFETIIELFESLLDLNSKIENGIVFTPKYISDYIIESVLKTNGWNETKSFIDPGCGGGIFLISAAEHLIQRFGLDVDEVIEKYIYGIDIEPDNVRRCVLSLRLLSAKYGGNFNSVKCNIHCCNSLKTDWAQEFCREKFSFVVGNPPYVNPHDMNIEMATFLKQSFKTTGSGVFNIFYAFIEQAMENISEDGVLGYIVPNNFLTIKSAINLRTYLQTYKYLSKIIDFGENMIFRPVRTYSCILILEKKGQDDFEYSVTDRSEDIERELPLLKFDSMETKKLDINGWKLVDEHTRKNLNKIENQMIPIKPFIRTGIATLKDAVFMVQKDSKGFFKSYIDGKKYIESDLIKPIYKIPELKSYDNIKDAERYIIFPYIKKSQGYVLISEHDLSTNYPLTYQVLLSCKNELDTRDKGRPNQQGWYAYGRTQGLNKYGKKLLFPTFSNQPKFIYIDNEEALFCNGYAIFENEYFDLKLLQKILNSKVMDYYIRNTSYQIEGGYYCYQKKYIENFSIPWLTDGQILLINSLSGKNLDDYLWDLYDLD